MCLQEHQTFNLPISRAAWGCFPCHQPWLCLAPVPDRTISVGGRPHYKVWLWEWERRGCGPDYVNSEARARPSHYFAPTFAASTPDTSQCSRVVLFLPGSLHSSHIPAPVTSDDFRQGLCCLLNGSFFVLLNPKCVLYPRIHQAPDFQLGIS